MAFLLWPVVVSAETFHTQRSVTLPPLTEPAIVGIELTPAMREENGYRIVTQTGFAVPFRADGVGRDLMPRATIVSAPLATAPGEGVERIRSEGSFQPVTAPEHVFVFSFEDDVAPVELAVELASGTIDAIAVRGGPSSDSLERLYRGSANGGVRAQLPGRFVRVVEVTIVASGPIRIDAIQLLNPPNFLFFRAAPGKTYTLFSGGADEGLVTLFPGYDALRGARYDSVHVARVGEPMPVEIQDDHDGVSPASDNCPDRWNFSQDDIDADGTGDFCDPCPTVAGGRDGDGNGRCDSLEDVDGDGVPAMDDNCPDVLNRLQEDIDKDGEGDACDATDDKLWFLRQPWWFWIVSIAGSLFIVWFIVFSLRLRD